MQTSTDNLTQEEDSVRINIALPAKLHIRLKAEAAQQRRTLRDHVIDTLASAGGPTDEAPETLAAA